jgi:hypothetical protein
MELGPVYSVAPPLTSGSAMACSRTCTIWSSCAPHYHAGLAAHGVLRAQESASGVRYLPNVTATPWGEDPYHSSTPFLKL